MVAYKKMWKTCGFSTCRVHFPGETLVFPTALQGSKTPSASPRARRDRRRTAHGMPSGWAFGGGDGRPMAGAIRNH